MDPRTLGHANARLDHIDEGRRVMIRDQLTYVDRLDECRVHDWASLAQGGDFGVGKNALIGESFCGQQLDLEHRVEAMLVAEELGHVLW
jgi:hypothetical protein